MKKLLPIYLIIFAAGTGISLLTTKLPLSHKIILLICEIVMGITLMFLGFVMAHDEDNTKHKKEHKVYGSKG